MVYCVHSRPTVYVLIIIIRETHEHTDRGKNTRFADG